MIDRADAFALLRSFHDPADGAAAKSVELALLLLESSATPFSRDHFLPGHITCTGLVLDPAGRVLVVHHRRLDRWLLPGGHVEADDASLVAAARREVVEETGADLIEAAPAPLIGVDVHGIPAKGDEPYHLHHDLLFAFRAVSDRIAVSAESHAVDWRTPADLPRYQVPTNVFRALGRLRAFTKV
jgi:8-oxo-dGTP pyrophosphatase MutT (NUDIX family)